MSRKTAKKNKAKRKKEKSTQCKPASISALAPPPVQVNIPSDEYLDLSNRLSTKRTDGKQQLLILDLNGTLVSRVGKEGATSFGMYVRPHQEHFLDYIFRYFKVMVWSSAQPASVERVCRLFGPRKVEMTLIWDRTRFGLTAEEFHRKSLTIKDLTKVWAELDHQYDATNTILIDDSREKSVLQPYNSIFIKTFNHRSPRFKQHGESELLHAIAYLDRLRTESNVANAIRTIPYVCSNIETMTHSDANRAYYYYNFYKQPNERRLIHLKNTSSEDEDSEA